MIKRLRRKFIVITMCSILTVLGGIIGGINIANYISINQRADEKLDLLVENQGRFPPMEGEPEKKLLPAGMSPEVPFETRYFTVVLNNENMAVSADIGRIAAISRQTAEEYAVILQEKGKKEGFEGQYKYRAVTVDGGIMYVFLDCGRELSTFYSFLAMSLLISVCGLLLVFALVLFFSKLAVGPFAESYEKQKRFITDASHEIKTPLTIIDANAEVLEMENGENEWTAGIKAQVGRLTALTEKLVYLSRMDEEHAKIQVTEFSLSDVAAETIQSFEAVAETRGKKLQAEVPPEIFVYGDESMIRQMLSLLLDNAVKYSSENGTIRFCLRKPGKHVEIILWNTVSEIRQGNLDILFERFYRPDSSRNSETEGYGIGLSAAKAVVTAHKGKIHARSGDGKSIEFRIVL